MLELLSGQRIYTQNAYMYNRLRTTGGSNQGCGAIVTRKAYRKPLAFNMHGERRPRLHHPLPREEAASKALQGPLGERDRERGNVFVCVQGIASIAMYMKR